MNKKAKIKITMIFILLLAVLLLVNSVASEKINKNSKELSPVWTAELNELTIAVGGSLTIDLDDYFGSNNELTYLVTSNENFKVEVDGSNLIITPLINKSVEGIITIVASDMLTSTRKELVVKSDFIDEIQQEALNSPIPLDESVVSSLVIAGTVEVLVKLDEQDLSDFNQLNNFDVISMKITREGLNQLKKNKKIKGIFENKQFKISTQDSIPLIKADKVHEMDITGAGRGICLLDTGVDLDHPILYNNVIAGYDFVNNDDIPDDDNNHGTHVAGIIKAAAPNSLIIPVKVCDANGICKGSDVLAGLNYCMEHAKDYSIVAISGSFGDGKQHDKDCPAYFGNAFLIMDNTNINSIFAAGNDGFKNGINYPACDPATISVSATTKEDLIAGFSNLGENLDLLAPGVDITSTIINGEGMMSGTSMSAPHIAGIIALIREINNTINPQSIKTTLKETGKTINNYPRVDAEKAIKHLIETQTTLPETNQTNGTIPDFGISALPTHSKPILNSTFGTNLTIENLTVHNQSTTDSDGDTITNIINWYKNGKSLTILNMLFDTNSSTTAKDYSGYENNGTITGPVWNNSGISGGAYVFDGTDDLINIPDSPSLDIVNEVTIEAWIKINKIGNQQIVRKTNAYQLIINNTGLRGLIGDGTSWTGLDAADGNINVVDGNWHHVVMTHDDSTTTTKVYVDGQLDVQNTGVSKNLGTNNNYIGIGGTTSNFFNGTIDKVRVYNQVLNIKQIASHYNAGVPDYNKIVSQETSSGETWHAEITPNDGKDDGITRLSNGLLIGTSPTHDKPILNSTHGTNTTNQNLTIYANNIQDDDNEPITANITNWYENGQSITALNLPFEAMTGHQSLRDEIGLYPFNNNYKDFSGYDNNGYCTNCPTYTQDGKLGGAYDFDGYGDEVILGSVPDYTSSEGTIAAWIYLKTHPSEDNTNRVIWSNYEDSSNRLYFFIHGTNQGLALYGKEGGVTSVEVYDKTYFPKNQWIHAVATFNSSGNVAKLYKNGVLVNTSTYTATTVNSQRIGAYPGLALITFNGTIDEVSIFNRSLSDSEIEQLYLDGLDKTGETLDYSGYDNDAVVKGPVWTSSGVYGGAYEFDGVNDYIEINETSSDSSLDITGNITIEAWVYARTGPGSAYILDKKGGTTYLPGYVLRASDSFWLFDVETSADYVQANVSAPLNAWQHIVGVYNGSYMSIYVNGTLSGTKIYNGAIEVNNYSLKIGGDAPWFFNGTIDEIKVYDRALSTDQIIENYNKGLSKHNKIVSSETEAHELWYAEITPNDGFNNGLTEFSNGLEINTAPTHTAPVLNSTSGLNLFSDNLTVYPQNLNDLDGEYLINITNWYVNNKSLMMLNMPFESLNRRHLLVSDGVVGVWYLEKNFKDFSGNRNDGSCTNCPTYTLNGRIGGAYEFDGINDHVNIPVSPSSILNINSNQVTQSAWIYPISNVPYGTIATRIGGYYFQRHNDGKLGVYQYGTTPAGYNYSTGTVPLNQWSHVAYTYNGTLLTFYINGVASGTVPKTGNLTQLAGFENSPFRIGWDGMAGARYFNGTIDEVHIFNYSLDADEMRSLYNKGIDKISNTLDYSSNAFDGSVYGPTWITGKLGGGYDFDGLNDYIAVDDSFPYLSENFTVDFWLKADGVINHQSLVDHGRDYYGSGWRIYLYNHNLWFTLNNNTANDYNELSINFLHTDTLYWHHLALVYNMSGAFFYVDGALKKTGNYMGPAVWKYNENLTIGRKNYNQSNYLDGKMDEVHIYNRSLSSNQIKALAEKRPDIIVSDETGFSDVWYADITVNDGWRDSITLTSNNLPIANTIPTIPIINITSTDDLNRTNGTLIGRHNYADLENNSWVANRTIWYKDSVEQTGFYNFTSITSNNTIKGETWIYSASVFDGKAWSLWLNSSGLIINNTLPIHSNPVLTSNGTLLCSNQSTFDLDDDVITNRIQWFNNSILVPNLENITAVSAGNTTMGQNWTCQVTPNDGVGDGSALMSNYLIIASNEADARAAIENGINNALAGAVIFTDYPIYTRMMNTSQYFAYFDKIVEDRNQTWAFNYISSGESYTNMPNIDNRLLIWENSSLLNSTIEAQVFNFINSTRE